MARQVNTKNTQARVRARVYLPFFAHLSLNYDANKHEIFMDFEEILWF